MKKILGIGFLILLSALIVFSGPLFERKLSLDSSISHLGNSGLSERVAQLENENEFLRNQISGSTQKTDSIKVYSSYPFNSRSEIAIAAGSEDGVEVGDVIVVSGNTLVGSVTQAFESSSIVTTIFDASWEMAVRVGESETDALMDGGNELKLTLIPKEQYIEVGETVVSAGRGFPYGLEVGSIKSIDDTGGDVFREAVINPNFSIKDLRNVAVYR